MTANQKSGSEGVDLTATDLVPRCLGGGRVLVVDSGEDAAVTLTAILRLNGFEAYTARTGADALKAMNTVRPGAVVIDLDLPDADACDVIRRVRGRPNPPAVVVLTGHTDPGHRLAAAQAGAAEYLLKPAEPTDLVRLLAQLCPAPPDAA
jgi:DNA-binding response OmpR family regulator